MFSKDLYSQGQEGLIPQDENSKSALYLLVQCNKIVLNLDRLGNPTTGLTFPSPMIECLKYHKLVLNYSFIYLLECISKTIMAFEKSVLGNLCLYFCTT